MGKEFLEVLFTCLDKYIAFITIVEALANFAIFFVFYNNVKNLIWKEVKLSCGTFKIRQKYFTVQNVTNVVSLKFYNGGTVPDDIRMEILEVICPKIKDIMTIDN
jgi:hypothetical protein